MPNEVAIDITVNDDTGPGLTSALGKVAAFRAAVKGVNDTKVTVKFSVLGATSNAMAKIAAFKAAMQDLNDTQIKMNVGASTTALNALANSLSKTNKAAQGTQATWRGWNFRIAGIAAWHIALDALLESLIVVTTATGAAALGVAALYKAMDNIATQTNSVNSVNSALGDQIPILGGAFRKYAESVGTASKAIEIYGGAANLINHGSSGFIQISKQVVNMFDTWVAKIDIWAQHSGTMNALLRTGEGFLTQFAQALGYLGDAVSHLLKEDPGVAHYLMDIVVALAHGIDMFSKLPAPIVTAVLALHGFYIWGKLIGTAMFSAAKSVWGFAKALPALAMNPLAWVGAAAIAVGYLAYEGHKAQSSVTGMIQAMEGKLSNEGAGSAMIQLASDIGTLEKVMHGMNLDTIKSQWTGLSGSIKETGYGVAYTTGKFWDGVKAFWQHGNLVQEYKDWNAALNSMIPGWAGNAAASQAMAENMKAINAEINKFLGSSRNLYGETGLLMKQGYSYSQALALMDLAGVRWNDTAAVMRQKVANLIEGYKQMSIQGGLLKNSVEAINLVTEMQDSKISQLNQAWDSFFSLVSGGESGFTSFMTQTIGLYKSLTAGGVKLSNSNGAVHSSLKLMATGTTEAKGSMTGLNATSMNLRNTFIQSAQAANTEMDNLTSMASAAGLGAKGTAMLTSATKDMVAMLLPAAKHSQAMTSILYALAQRGGYQGADSFRALSHWVSAVHDPMRNLDKITTILTSDSANLMQDVRHLSTALGVTLNNAMSTAIFMADGGQKAFNNLATAISKTGTNSSDTHKAAVPLAAELIRLTGNTQSAHKEFDTFVVAMGKTKSQADKLWASVVNTAKAIDGLHSKTITISGHASGSGKIIFNENTGVGRMISGGLQFLAGGGPVHGIGTATSDSNLAKLSKGEYVVNAKSTAKHLPLLNAINAKGYASGGLFHDLAAPGNFMAEREASFERAVESSFMNSVTSAYKRAAASALASSGATGGGAGANQAIGMRMAAQYGWTGIQWADLVRLWNMESGWNRFARNPTSGAYGIAQALPPTKYPFAGQAAGGSHAGAQIGWGLGYIRGRYGSPMGALGHELQYGWYDHGGDLRPGFTLAYNGTGRTEHVSPAGSATTLEVVPGGSGDFERFMARFIKNFVRVKGGGNVQAAFGRN